MLLQLILFAQAMSAAAMEGGTTIVTPTGSASRAVVIEAPLRRAGVYHLPTQTWRSGATLTGLGPGVIYNSSCSSPAELGIWVMEPGESLTDEVYDGRSSVNQLIDDRKRDFASEAGFLGTLIKVPRSNSTNSIVPVFTNGHSKP